MSGRILEADVLTVLTRLFAPRPDPEIQRLVDEITRRSQEIQARAAVGIKALQPIVDKARR